MTSDVSCPEESEPGTDQTNPADQLAWHRVLATMEGVGPATVRRLEFELGVTDQDDDGTCQTALASVSEGGSDDAKDIGDPVRHWVGKEWEFHCPGRAGCMAVRQH